MVIHGIGEMKPTILVDPWPALARLISKSSMGRIVSKSKIMGVSRTAYCACHDDLRYSGYELRSSDGWLDLGY